MIDRIAKDMGYSKNQINLSIMLQDIWLDAEDYEYYTQIVSKFYKII